MVINLVGKFGNSWGAEWLCKRGFEQLGHEVNGLELMHGYSILRNIKVGALTVVMQGYGMKPKLIESMRRLTKQPVVLWHAEVLSPEWPSSDPVVQNKAYHFQQNAYAFDAIGHNCKQALETVEKLSRGGDMPRVFWAPSNGVDAQVHRRIEGIAKKYSIGMYGYLSPRRIEALQFLRAHNIHVEYRKPEDGCFGEDLTLFINQCERILNLHYSDTPNTECRIYEALGCGVPVISEQISMPELFPSEHCHINYIRDVHDLYVNAVPTSYTCNLHGTEAMAWIHANASYAQRCECFIDGIRAALPQSYTW